MAESQELVFRIKNRQVLEDMVNNLRTTYYELRDANPNMRDIQMHSKLRWQSTVQSTLEFLEKLLPPPTETKDS